MSKQSGKESQNCLVCGGNLEYSIVGMVRGYCDVCKPSKCPKCGCVNIKQQETSNDQTQWECDNGCSFEVKA